MPPKKKTKTTEEKNTGPMDLEKATEYLKKMDEWWTLRNMDRSTIIKWAEFLKNREDAKNTSNS